MKNCEKENNRCCKLSKKIEELKNINDNSLFCREFMNIKDEIITCLCYLAEKNYSNNCYHCKSNINETYIFLIIEVCKLSERCTNESCVLALDIFERIYAKLAKVLGSCCPKDNKNCKCKKRNKCVKVIIVDCDDCGNQNGCECLNEEGSCKINKCSNQGVCKLNDSFEHNKEENKNLKYNFERYKESNKNQEYNFEQDKNKDESIKYDTYEKAVKNDSLREEVKKERVYKIKEEYEEYEEYKNNQDDEEQNKPTYQHHYLNENKYEYDDDYEDDDYEDDEEEYDDDYEDDDKVFGFNVFTGKRNTWR